MYGLFKMVFITNFYAIYSGYVYTDECILIIQVEFKFNSNHFLASTLSTRSVYLFTRIRANSENQKYDIGFKIFAETSLTLININKINQHFDSLRVENS